MKSSDGVEFQVQLENKERDGYTTITVRVEVDEGGRAHIRAVGQPDREGGAETYRIGLVVRAGQGGDHCWVCMEEPCPPNKLTWVSPCPVQP